MLIVLTNFFLIRSPIEIGFFCLFLRSMRTLPNKRLKGRTEPHDLKSDDRYVKKTLSGFLRISVPLPRPISEFLIRDARCFGGRISCWIASSCIKISIAKKDRDHKYFQANDGINQCIIYLFNVSLFLFFSLGLRWWKRRILHMERVSVLCPSFFSQKKINEARVVICLAYLCSLSLDGNLSRMLLTRAQVPDAQRNRCVEQMHLIRVEFR